MFKNIKWATGALKKVPTFFRLEIQNIDFQICDGFFSLRDLQGSQEVVSSGTSINVVTMTKRGPGKSSTLKQLQATTTTVGQHHLSAQFNENFDFKASLFYESDGTCIPKILRLNINRVCRIEDSTEYSVLLLANVNVQLHDVPNTGKDIFQIPLTIIDSKTIMGTLTVKLTMFENKSDFDLDDNVSVSSIGSNLSFMQRESVSNTNNKKSTTSASIQSRTAVRRKTGGQMPEAGLPGRFSRSSSAELETLLTDMSIVKMHLDKALADKSNMEATHKDDMREVAYLRMERVKQTDLLKVKDEQILDLERNNDMLCKAMTKLQGTLVVKDKELSLLKQERKQYLKHDRILDLKDKALLAELTKASEQVTVAETETEMDTEEYLTLLHSQGRNSSSSYSSNRSNRSNSSSSSGSMLATATDRDRDGDRDTVTSEDSRGLLFLPDEVDYEATASLKQKPGKAALFNEDVLELMKSHVTPAGVPGGGGVSGGVSASGGRQYVSSPAGGMDKRPSLFTDDVDVDDDDVNDNDDQGDKNVIVNDINININGGVVQDQGKEKEKEEDKRSKGDADVGGRGRQGGKAPKVAVHVRSTSPSGFVTYTPSSSSSSSTSLSRPSLSSSSSSTSSSLLQQL